jgi:Flp pilus assembly pilin Flp
MRKLLWKIRNSVCNEEGITTVEVILLLVVLIAVVLVFKEQILDLVETIMDKITKQAARV